MIYQDMPDLDSAINEESYDFLSDRWPLLAEAVTIEVKRGAKPVEIRRHIMRKTYREALALRCEQAACHLAAINGRE